MLPTPVPFHSNVRRGEVAARDRELELRASAGEHARQVASRWKGSERRAIVPADEVRALRDRTLLHLGESREHGTLMAILPRGQGPVTPPSAMLGELLPELDTGWALGVAEARVRQTGERRPGLFWDGPQPYHAGAWSYAMLRSGGGCRCRPLVVGPMPTKYRDTVPADSGRLVDGGQGRARLTGLSRTLSWTGDGEDHALEHTAALAAMADYHLWWAHRLHSYVHADRGNPRDLWLGRLAAQRGLRYVERLTGVIQHMRQHDAPTGTGGTHAT